MVVLIIRQRYTYFVNNSIFFFKKNVYFVCKTKTKLNISHIIQLNFNTFYESQ